MIIIRPIARKDQDNVAEFSFESLLGMTNLPRDRTKLLDKIIHSESSFLAKVEESGEEEYYFVLEDITTGRIGGTCGILALSTQSFGYVYKIETIKSVAQEVPTPKELKILRVAQNPPDSSEVCALYLKPSFRHSGQGRLLSLSRFLFMAAFRERFRRKIVAELRGYIDIRQISPFWDSIGRHFCDLSFVELMAHVDQSHEFIKGILPKYPIYISLLPKEAQEVIGKTHDSTKPAYQMLEKENFTYNQEIDVLEGGPILSAKTKGIRTIKNSVVVKADITTDPLEGQSEYIIGNEKLDFRACFGKMLLTSKTQGLINEEVANALLINRGDKIRYVTIH